MSLLWLDPWRAALMPGRSWLQQGRRAPDFAGTGFAAEADELLAALQSLLVALPARRGRRQVIDLVVSDSVAAVVPLPWQEHLTTPAEWHAYAQMCFERQGLIINAQWVMQTAYRQHGVAGIAYALPADWLRKLLTLLSDHGLRLRTVLPLSAAAYWRQRQAHKAATTVLLLCEARRISALTYIAGRFSGMDVEPMLDNAVVAASRLLRRVQSGTGPINVVQQWSGEAAWVQACLPQAAVALLPHDIWS